MKQMKKTACICTGICDDHHDLSAISGICKEPKTRLNAKTMTLQVGQKKTLKVKNAGKKAKLKWSSNKKSIATVSKKGVVKAVKAGNAVVTCKVTTKNGKTTKLTCKVAVKKTAKVTSLTVGSQSELEKALKNKNVTKITVATQGAVTFTVPQGNYSKVDLVINAPNADVVNNGKFKSIDIQAIKPNTYRENAKGNVITVSATGDARVIVETGATVAKIMVSGSKGNVKLVVDGTLSGITIDAPVNVTVEGKTTVAVPVTVNEKAAGANVTSSTPVEVKAAAPITLNLTKGAEGSKVETTSNKAEVTVKNETTQAVTVTTPAGSKDVAKDTTSKVDNAGKVTDIADNTDANNNGGGATGGSSSSRGSVTPTPSVGKMDKAQNVVKNIEKNELPASISALQNPMICQKVLFDEIQKKFNEDEKLKDIYFEVSYNETIEKNDLKLFAFMWVTIYGENDEKYEIYGNVTFICTESEIQVSAPEIKHILKHSLVVAVEPTYEYACVTSGTAISTITEDEWVQGNESDDFGCYEMSGLNENTEYVVYKRIIDVDEYYGSTTVTTTGGKETVCLAEADGKKEFKFENVKTTSLIRIPLDGLKTACYGLPENNGEHGSFEFACDDSALNDSLNGAYTSLEYSKEEENVFFTFEVPEDLKARTYVVKFNYYFGRSVRKSDGEWDEYTSKSDPIPYTVTFTVQ